MCIRDRCYPQKGSEPPPQFSAHFYCGQTSGCIKMPLDMDVGLSPGEFLLDGDPPSPLLAHVYCGQTAGWIKMVFGMEVGLGPVHIVLDGDPVPPPPKGHSSQFSGHVCCCKMAAWIKMSLGIEIGLGPGHIVLDGNPSSPPQKGGTGPSIFGPCLLWPNSWMDQDAILLVLTLTSSCHQIHTHGVHQLCFSRLSQLFVH